MIIYRVAVYLALPFVLIGLFFKGFRNQDYWQRWTERLGISIKSNTPFDLWVHAVSVGEVRAAAPLIQLLLDKNPNYKILVTTTTPTGSNMLKMMLQERVSHCYLPYDVGCCMRHFLKSIKPRVSLIMETEIWPNLIRYAKAQNSTLIYTNVRLSERSYNKYAKLLKPISQTLCLVDLFAVQGQLDAKHLKLLGVKEDKIKQTGSIKFDVNMPASLRESSEVLRRQLGQDRLIWIAGSTREGEESLLLDCYIKLKQQFPSLLFIVVPRHPERFDSVERKIQRKNLKHIRRSQLNSELGSEVDVFLGDSMGELALMYAASDIAFVGGSLVPLGGQNILEPCALGVPVLFGPHMFNFPDISRWTIHQGAGKMVQDKAELITSLETLLANPNLRDEMGTNGIQFVKAHRGAVEQNLKLIEQYLNK